MLCRFLCITVLTVSIAGCGTLEGYRQFSGYCAYYLQRNELAKAHGACFRALVEARGANLGPKAESDALYIISIVYRRDNDLPSAEQNLTDSLAALEKLPFIQAGSNSPYNSEYARRLAELVLMQEEQSKLTEACQTRKRFAQFEKSLHTQLLTDFNKQSRTYGKDCEKSKQ